MATRTRTRANEPQPRARVAALQRVARDTVAEMKKITWPDRETTRNLTLVVIAISVVLGLLLGGVDAAFVRLWSIF
ncbi:preprotein translocase subunit SecE [Sphaerobacter thermophilus]|uniref:Protein translocase subunit SecE n=1 Tax=Sphaerobacter thermophilus (strain ATCC 49802 / DSM 20745 / KCCM 41009 / NCIMB 13125 / S 6022) TaxID=479434 RepID=D1C476_SPHTD|nr:preprotein translocase subunit SecE [Sphaerobacter thermophilus]ACZ39043.1 preprotein translocase, SecE subunit [Sphaerobacter thermophilus DSM 20745]